MHLMAWNEMMATVMMKVTVKKGAMMALPAARGAQGRYGRPGACRRARHGFCRGAGLISMADARTMADMMMPT